VIALRFAELGAQLIVDFFRNRKPAEQTAADIRTLGRQALVKKDDIGTDKGLDHLFQEIENNFNGLDILVNNAASGYNRPALQQKTSGWDWTMKINARSLLFGAHHTVPLMESLGGEYIVSISSPGALRVLPE
jgi:enoyl-[acyl-carrier protein] reductase III